MSPALPRDRDISVRDDDIDLETNELGRDVGESFGVSFRPTIIDRNGAALDPTKFPHPGRKSVG
jgi:hypothetical protein